MSCSVTEDLGRAVLPSPAASPFRCCVRDAVLLHRCCAAGIANLEILKREQLPARTGRRLC